MNITKNFTLEEMYSSSSAQKYNIDNRPNAEECKRIHELASNLLQPLRDAYGKPIIITSGFRCKKLNQRVYGSPTSAHMLGYAADTKASNMKEYQEFVLNWIKDKKFDQCIIEYPKNGVASWIHIGYKNQEGKQRKQFLTIK